MILTSERLLDYLLERRLLAIGGVVDGDYRVLSRDSRHRTFRVFRRDGPGLFLKQPLRWDPQTLTTLHREVAFFQQVVDRSTFVPLHSLLPRFRAFDPLHHVLALDLVGEGESLNHFHHSTGMFPAALGTALGEGLGQFHLTFLGAGHEGERKPPYPTDPPWILSIHRGSLYDPRRRPRGAAAQLVELIRRDPSLTEALDTQHRRWRPETWIHGDLKLQNCVRLPDAETGQSTVKFVDWEMISLGEATWDVGSLLQSYLTLWTLSIPLPEPVAGSTPIPSVEDARIPLAALHPLLHRFWESYRALYPPSGRVGLLERSFQAAGARLLQTAYEYGAVDEALQPHHLFLVQLASNILRQPLLAAEELLELTP